MKTIAIDLTSLDDNFSGIEHYALFITKELIKCFQYQFFLIFKNKPSYFASKELEQKNVTVHILSGKRLNIMLFDLPKLIDRLNPDIALFLAFQPSFLWKPKGKTKVFTTIHDLVAFDVPQTMKFRSCVYFRKTIKHSLKISERIITISQFSKNRIVDKFHCDANKIILAYCSSAMDTSIKSKDYIQKKYNLPEKYILTLSTVEPRKNIHFLLSCLDELWNQDEAIPNLVIAGRKGWKTDKLFKNISERGKENIRFTGFIDDEDVASIYYYSLFFIFPSLYEGFGIPVLESLKVGRLPLCSNIPTNKELLGEDYPFLFNPTDKESFFSVFKKYITNEGIQYYESENIKQRCKEFEWAKGAHEIIKEFR